MSDIELRDKWNQTNETLTRIMTFDKVSFQNILVSESVSSIPAWRRYFWASLTLLNYCILTALT